MKVTLDIVMAIISCHRKFTTENEWAFDLIDHKRESVMLDISFTHRLLLILHLPIARRPVPLRSKFQETTCLEQIIAKSFSNA